MTNAEIPVLSRAPLEGMAEAYSGARLERVVMADGRRLVFKHLPPSGDWLTRVSGGTDRVRRLWESGLLARMAPFVDHTVIDVIRLDDHDVVVMRDVSDLLLPPLVPVSRVVSRRLLAGLAAFHEAGRNEPIQHLCPIGAHYGMFRPLADRRPGANPNRDRIVAGWEIFAHEADADVAAVALALHCEPEILGRRLARLDATLVHGDVKLENLGLGPNLLIAVDWGDLTGFGPIEIDVAWYAVQNTWRIGGSPGDAFADYEAVASRPLDRESLDLACVGSLAQMGWKLAHRAVTDEQAKVRTAARAQLDWWTARVRAALDRVGSL